jgi:hypothetical protein
MIRVLAVIAVVMTVIGGGHASNPLGPEPIATLDLSQLPAGTKDASAQSIAFVSDTSIAVSLCPNGSPTGCALSLLRRDGNTLRAYAASTSHFRRGRSIHVSSGGQILITPFAGSPAVLFTPDLSVTRELPTVFLASPSGNTGTEITKSGWKLYQIRSQNELIREGKGSFRSVSDEVILFQDGNVMHIETLQGAPLGSFSVKPEMKCYNLAYPLGTNRLYLDDCKKIRIVDFGGREQSELHPPNGWRAHQFWSRDGKRILFDNFDRKISIVRKSGEALLAIGTLGAGALDEQDNREEVLVLDTSSGDSCFDWKRSFSEGSVALAQDAAISPSGEFVAIAAGGTLSVYRLPDVCRRNK